MLSQVEHILGKIWVGRGAAAAGEEEKEEALSWPGLM